MVVGERRYTPAVYDPTRLAQEVEDALKRGRAFLEPNLLVVASVTPENIASAILEVVQGGRLDDLRPNE